MQWSLTFIFLTVCMYDDKYIFLKEGVSVLLLGSGWTLNLIVYLPNKFEKILSSLVEKPK